MHSLRVINGSGVTTCLSRISWSSRSHQLVYFLLQDPDLGHHLLASHVHEYIYIYKVKALAQAMSSLQEVLPVTGRSMSFLLQTLEPL